MLLSDGGLMEGHDDSVQLDPEVLQTRAIFDAARSGLLECVSGSQEMIDLAEAQRLLDALKTARTLAAEAEDRVLMHRSLLTAAEVERRAAARCPVGWRGSDQAGDHPRACAIRPRSVRAPALSAASRGAATVLVRAVLPAAAALAGASIARRIRQR